MNDEQTVFGQHCPKGKVQVEFVGVKPRKPNGKYGWKPSDSAFLEIYVDGQRFRINIGDVPMIDGTTRRGIQIFTPLNSSVRKDSVNTASVLLDETES